MCCLLNGYADAHGRIEGNVESTLLPSARWGTTVLGHYSQTLHTHDENHDGLADRPKTEQFNLMNRWTYNGDHLLSQFYLRGLKETREGGQFAHHGEAMNDPYRVTIDTKRVEATNKRRGCFTMRTIPTSPSSSPARATCKTPTMTTEFSTRDKPMPTLRCSSKHSGSAPTPFRPV